MTAVDDQAVAGELGGEGPVVWVEEDLGFLVVEPLADQREPGFVDGLFGAEQQPVPVRAVRLRLGGGEAILFGRCGDQVQDAVGKRGVGFGVDADGGDPRLRDRRRRRRSRGSGSCCPAPRPARWVRRRGQAGSEPAGNPAAPGRLARSSAPRHTHAAVPARRGR